MLTCWLSVVRAKISPHQARCDDLVWRCPWIALSFHFPFFVFFLVCSTYTNVYNNLNSSLSQWQYFYDVSLLLIDLPGFMRLASCSCTIWFTILIITSNTDPFNFDTGTVASFNQRSHALTYSYSLFAKPSRSYNYRAQDHQLGRIENVKSTYRQPRIKHLLHAPSICGFRFEIQLLYLFLSGTAGTVQWTLFERFSRWLSRSQKSLIVSHRYTSFESFYDQEPELNSDRSSRSVVANTALGPTSLLVSSIFADKSPFAWILYTYRGAAQAQATRAYLRVSSLVGRTGGF